MWAKQEKCKNIFLQKQLTHLEPQKINEIVNKEFDKHQSGHTDCNSIHDQPSPKELSKSTTYFQDRAQLAYGFWALPKLMHELGSDDNVTQWKAINSLADYMINPLHAQRAIMEFDIVRRCQNVLLRIRLKSHKVKERETGRLLAIFAYIALHPNGAKKIIQKFRLLDQFYTIVRERELHMDEVTKILGLLTQNPENVHYLIDDYKIFEKLKTIWNHDICILYYPEDLWLHLSHILELAPQQAIDCGFFDVLYTRIKGRLHQYHHWDMKCFGFLLRCPEGQKRFTDIDGVKEIYTILKDRHHKLDTYENLIFTLMNGLMAKVILWRCREFTDLPLIIMEFAKEAQNYNQQLLCLQTLREMGVMPCIKRFIKANCLEDLMNIQCETLVNEKALSEIVNWLKREIYHTTDLKNEIKC